MNSFDKLIEHCQEKYPHFESERGKGDISAAIEENKKLKLAVMYLMETTDYEDVQEVAGEPLELARSYALTVLDEVFPDGSIFWEDYVNLAEFVNKGE